MKATIILAAALAATSASAEFITGNQLLDRMNSDLGYDRGVAAGYVMGAWDSSQGILHCAPAGITLGQIHDMVKQALINAPAVRHNSADAFVVYAANKAWPCPKKNNGTNL